METSRDILLMAIILHYLLLLGLGHKRRSGVAISGVAET